MNSTIVISWVAMGFFAAWIATHSGRTGRHNSGVGNLTVGVWGSLLGGLVGYGSSAAGRDTTRSPSTR